MAKQIKTKKVVHKNNNRNQRVSNVPQKRKQTGR